MVSTEALVSIVLACISLIGTVGLGVWQTWYASSLEAAQRRRDINKQVQRYRDPLLLAAWELQSRLYDVLDTDIPPDEVRSDDKDKVKQGKDNLKTFSSYLLARFLAWTWILRERTQFLAFSEASHWKRLREILYKIEDELDRKVTGGVNYGSQPSDRLLVSERAIKFPATREESYDEHQPLQPMRWDEFYDGWEDRFAKPLEWFTNSIMGALYAKWDGRTPKDQRLRRMQHLLMDLIQILDPEKTMKSDRPDAHAKCVSAEWCDCDDGWAGELEGAQFNVRRTCWKGQSQDVHTSKNRRELHDNAHGYLRVWKAARKEGNVTELSNSDNSHGQTGTVDGQKPGLQPQDPPGTAFRGTSPDLEKGNLV